jgi:hypothetical protein
MQLMPLRRNLKAADFFLLRKTLKIQYLMAGRFSEQHTEWDFFICRSTMVREAPAINLLSFSSALVDTLGMPGKRSASMAAMQPVPAAVTGLAVYMICNTPGGEDPGYIGCG